MSVTRPLLCCAACQGSGKVVLSAPLFSALTFVRRVGRITPAELHRRLRPTEVNPTAMNARLEALRELGLVDRERVDGRSWAYFAREGES